MDNNLNEHGRENCMSTPVIDTECKRLKEYQEVKIQIRIDEAKKFYNEGKFEYSLLLLEEPYEILKKMTSEHNFTLYVAVANFIGILSSKLKNYDDALKYFNEVYEKQKIIGADTSMILSNKAAVLCANEKYEEAREILRKVYAARRNKLGFDHADTLRTRHNTACVLHAQNKYKEALEIYTEVYNIKLKKLGDNDPSTLISQYNMASSFSDLGELKDALTNFHNVFEKRKITNGLHHPDTLDTWRELESVLAKQLKCDKEIEVYEHLHKGQAADLRVDKEDAMLMLEKTADFCNEQRDYDEAYCRYNKLYELMKETADPYVLNIQNKIGLLLHIQGKEKKALEIFEDVYMKMSALFGGYNYETLFVKYNIGVILLEKGELSRALETFAYIYTKSLGIWGINDPFTLNALEQKANVLTFQRHYDRALKIYEYVYNKRKFVHGPEHKYTLITGTHMAEVHVRQGSYGEAHVIFTEVLKIQKENNDQNGLLTWGIIADMFAKQRKYKQALKIYKKILPQQIQSFGHDHRYTLKTSTALASVLSSLGRLDDALQMLEKTHLEIKNKLGPEHTGTLTAELQVASVLRLLGKYEEAISILEKVKHIPKETFVALSVRKSLAEMLKARGKNEEASSILRDVLEIQKHMSYHPEIFDTLYAIAKLNIDLYKYHAALEILNKIYSTSENTFGSENTKTLDIQNSIAGVFLKMDKYEEALKIFTKIYCVLKRSDILGPDHPETLSSYNNMASALYELGKYEESLGMMTEVYEKYKKFEIFSPKHPNMLTIENIIASILIKLGKYGEALNMFNANYAKMVEILGATHPNTIVTKQYIKHMEYLNSR